MEEMGQKMFNSKTGWEISKIGTEADLLYRTDGDTGCTRHNQVAVLDVWSNLVQNKWDDVWLHSQEEHVAFVDRLFVASCQVHSHFLHMIKTTIGG